MFKTLYAFYKKQIIAASIITLILLVLLGSGIYAVVRKPAPKKVTVTFWGYWDTNVVSPLIEEFEKTNPYIKISYEKREIDRYRETLQNRIDNDTGPDIFFYHSKWVPMLLRQLSSVPETVYDAESFSNTFLPIAKKDLTVSNKIWGVPVSFEGLSLLYNNELFLGSNLSQPPSTWDDLRINYLPSLTVKNKDNQVQTAGIALGAADNVDYSTQILQVMMAQNGVDFIKNGQLKVHNSMSSDNPPRNLGADALSFYNSFASDQSSTWSADLPHSLEAFAKGNVAMVFAPNSQINDILRVSQESKVPLDLKVAKVPQITQKASVSWGFNWAVGVSSVSKNQSQSWEFVKFLTSKQAIQTILSTQKRLETVPDIPARVDIASQLKDDPYLAVFIEQAPNSMNFWGGDYTFDNGLNDTLSEYFHEMINSGSGKPEAALSAAGAKIEQKFYEFGILVPPNTGG